MWVRIIELAAVAFVSIATVCSTGAGIAVSLVPGANLDSAARTAYALAARVTARRGLTPYDPPEVNRAGREMTCFAKRSFLICGQVNPPEVQFSISQRGSGFSPWADSVRAELRDSLRVEFGAFRVWECKWQTQRDTTGGRPQWGCPPLSQHDSG